MRRRTGVALLALVGLVALAVLLTEGPVQGAKPPADIPLKATFRSLDTDSILNDIDGPYVTLKGGGVSVYFTGDNGELVFTVNHHAARRVRVIFPLDISNPVLGLLPDTEGVNGPAEPVDFFKFRTWNSVGFAGPKMNLLKMKDGEEQPVRLWTTVCTTQRHYYFMNYLWGEPLRGNISGVVWVKASGAGPDGFATKWEIYPVPGYDAAIYKQSESGKTVFYYFGDGPMPFQLTLEKQ